MSIITDTGNIKLTPEEYQQLHEERDRACAERDAAIKHEMEMRTIMNRWQMILQSALGNVSRVTKDIQAYLRDEAAVENK